MGYTHYWHQKRDLTNDEWSILTTKVREILDATTVALESDILSNGTSYQVTDDIIEFNGFDDEAHETFIINRLKRERSEWTDVEQYNRDGAFDCCKTAQKPYDEVVLAILLVIRDTLGEAFSVSSDGDIDNDDGEEARELLKKAFINAHIKLIHVGD